MHGDPSTAGGYSPHLQDSGNILPDQLHVVRFSGVARCSLGVAYRAQTDRDRRIFGRKEARTSDLRRYNYNV